MGLLEALVTTESHAAHQAGIAAVAGLVTGELTPLGFAFEEIAPAPVPPADRWLEDLFSPGVAYPDLGHTYAGLAEGTAGGRLLLLGDLDTAFPTGTLEDFPFRIDGGRAYGPGIADMKAGLVALVAALQALDHLALDRPAISLVLAGDEQAGSLGSRPVIEEAGRNANWCLCVECARRGGKLMAARGHIGVGSIRVTGLEAHTGSAREAGVDALEALAQLILAFKNVSDPDAGTLVTVTIARGGRRRSIVPALAEATVDIRTKSIDQWEKVTTAMRAIAAETSHSSGAEVELLMHSHRPGIVWDEGTDQLLGLARTAAAELSIQAGAFESVAAGSSAFRHGSTPTLDGLGPSGAGLMTRDEHIELDSLVPRAAMLAGLIHRLPTLLSEG